MHRVRNRLFFFIDLLLLPAATYLAYVIRFEGNSWSREIHETLLVFLLVAVPLKLLVLYGFGMYRRLWRYASIADLELILGACVISGILCAATAGFVLPGLHLMAHRAPYSVLVLDAGLSTLFVAAPRFLARARARRDRRSRSNGARPTIVVGAGAAGGLMVRELLENGQLGISPVGFLDDDPAKQGLRLHNVPVLGTIADLDRVAAELDATEVIIAIPSAPGRVVRDIVRRAGAAGLQPRTVPGLYEILSGEKSVSALRKIEIQDLLRREPIVTDTEQVKSLVTGQTVLVTGAGGSIGSELCRQLARLEPERIIALGRGENSIFELLQELHRDFPRLRVDPVIADVRDDRRMQRVFSSYRPFSVFHAAAHKHVPLMEANVAEAILNNVRGTRNVVECAALVEAEHFVLVSTDKAVRPTSVMGATKRIAEHLVHEAASAHSAYVAVRFGNVLGSRGSVVPTFMRQIAAGGPVTITHPNMTRYFMTIPEAVQLVLQAAAMGQRGEVFVLDMGDPVKVLDLACDMIRLSGLEVGNDIEIKFTGTRPGEKLYEELFFSAQHAMPTSHSKIQRAMDSAFPADGHERIRELIDAAAANRPSRELRRMIAQLVPEYAGGSDTGEFAVTRPAPKTEADASAQAALL
ncbi:MAG: polysaccharide biosynthesis protein CapD [Gemmatimonadetes bacterium]|jgi:FlaA1/EpsC-like NDP-sugar epimerase|nr:polysaccharide biosynthesis protein CapD [Gemmatimonadota bacterium]